MEKQLTVGQAIKMLAEQIGRFRSTVERLEERAEERAIERLSDPEQLADHISKPDLDRARQIVHARETGQILPADGPYRHSLAERKRRRSEDDTGVIERYHRSTGERRSTNEIIGSAVVYGFKKAAPHILTGSFFATLVHVWHTYWRK